MIFICVDSNFFSKIFHLKYVGVRTHRSKIQIVQILTPFPEKSIDFVDAFFNEIRLTASEIAPL